MIFFEDLDKLHLLSWYIEGIFIWIIQKMHNYPRLIVDLRIDKIIIVSIFFFNLQFFKHFTKRKTYFYYFLHLFIH